MFNITGDWVLSDNVMCANDPDAEFCAYMYGYMISPDFMGSPLMIRNTTEQIGIFSYGVRECDTTIPSVYTVVAAYTEWIEAALNFWNVTDYPTIYPSAEPTTMPNAHPSTATTEILVTDKKL